MGPEQLGGGAGGGFVTEKGRPPAIADFRAELAVHAGEASAAYLFEELTTDPDGCGSGS